MLNYDQVVSQISGLRVLVARPENDFSWSSWRDTEHALSEIDEILVELKQGGAIPFGRISSILLPTGPAQELAESSGWGDEFVAIANKIDTAISNVIKSCPCNKEPAKELALVRELGMDDRFAEASLLQCSNCWQHWLRYQFENEAFSRSGRWYLGCVPDFRAMKISAADAKTTLESLDQYFCGGSYFGGVVKLSSGPILLA